MVGFYGKLPAKGDFLSRRLPREFIDQWDDWLQVGMNDSREALGDSWLQTYLTSPLWRFVLPANTLSADAWAGVFMPSMDKVGRYFPMMAAVPLAASSSPLLVAAACATWFEEIETQLLSALDDEELDMDQFASTLQGVDMPVPTAAPATAPSALDQGVRLPLDANVNVAHLFLQQSISALQPSLGACCIWWGQGSDLVAPSLVLSHGLPGPGQFTALLDGNWANWGWTEGGDVTAGITPTKIDLATL
jgi:type VI secretion system protein ImpM